MIDPIEYVDPYAVTKKIETIKRSIPVAELYARHREAVRHFEAQLEIAREQMRQAETQLGEVAA